MLLVNLPAISTENCDWWAMHRPVALHIELLLILEELLNFTDWSTVDCCSGLVLESLLNTRRVIVTMKTIPIPTPNLCKHTKLSCTYSRGKCSWLTSTVEVPLPSAVSRLSCLETERLYWSLGQADTKTVPTSADISLAPGLASTTSFHLLDQHILLVIQQQRSLHLLLATTRPSTPTHIQPSSQQPPPTHRQISQIISHLSLARFNQTSTQPPSALHYSSFLFLGCSRHQFLFCISLQFLSCSNHCFLLCSSRQFLCRNGLLWLCRPVTGIQSCSPVASLQPPVLPSSYCPPAQIPSCWSPGLWSWAPALLPASRAVPPKPPAVLNDLRVTDVWECLLVYLWGIFKDLFLDWWRCWDAGTINIGVDLQAVLTLLTPLIPFHPSPCSHWRTISVKISLWRAGRMATIQLSDTSGTPGKKTDPFSSEGDKRSIRGQSRKTLRGATWLWGWDWGGDGGSMEPWQR